MLTSSPHWSGVGNSQGPLGAIDWTGRSRFCGMTGMSKLSPLIEPACQVETYLCSLRRQLPPSSQERQAGKLLLMPRQNASRVTKAREGRVHPLYSSQRRLLICTLSF